MKNLTFATRWNADALDEYFAQWTRDPQSVDGTWAAFFEGFELARNGQALATAAPAAAAVDPVKQARFTGAIYAYRSIGHTQADINPLEAPAPNVRLSLQRLGFGEEDLEQEYETGNFHGAGRLSVRELLRRLHATYCGKIGVEYLHLQETPQRRWLQERMEPSLNEPQFAPAAKQRVLRKIVEAEQFEKFLHTRFVGQKRFSLEGGETIMACLDAIVQNCPRVGLEEVILGMAHRGRLNVLVNTVGKPVEVLFEQFSENYFPDLSHGDGDVKYHLGYDGVVETEGGGRVTVRLVANPSHLEAVNPVVEGRARARQRAIGDLERKRVLPVLIHGDAAFAGQGMVAEVLNLSKLKGYTTGGTIHFIINNQIGFTTNPSEARSSRYCTDVAKMIEAPIFHVNGDDPLAMVMVTQLALEYRQQFANDVVIDMVCYRRLGHNESDEPAFTQPLMYRQLASHPLISETLARRLEAAGEVTAAQVEAMRGEVVARLEAALAKARETEGRKGSWKDKFKGSTAVFQPPFSFEPAKTASSKADLDRAVEVLTTFPAGFTPNPKIARLLEQRAKAWAADTGVEWAFAESLAWGTLLLEGTPVRLSGQDCERGTFSQRHAAIYDTHTRERLLLLERLKSDRAWICVHNSLLSEAAVLGFDFGYSVDFPDMLVQWEAQFGDFVNGAQVIIDQFVASSESKWQRVSGLVMLLPHGYEGQGPEHSSARLERFLQLGAENNIQVGNLSTPAQYYHALKRQVRRGFRKPLVLMTPKSLLRHRECVSKVEDFTSGTFVEIMPDAALPAGAKRVVACSGKVYYDLLEYRRANKLEAETALVRVEQLYPFHRAAFGQILEAHPGARLVWCQEEPQNMGAWSFLAPLLEEVAGRKAAYAGRDAAASPAVGSVAVHRVEQAALVEQAFTI